ncbi:hypothetical protein FEM03_10790 [Phragmitibacter flavus]|uniref:PEP-CTERM sorting domain-containing protein n=1 Tax=Phragmitibacter flavus TaxID=2576071 RepID=A0A5R8KEV2_9BACT|nr:hypothetical protein [Phragmitibacter flavus]TLD70787.1 hypothetical protein FEM03_10790 [Phragmitibacter flavus]
MKFLPYLLFSLLLTPAHAAITLYSSNFSASASTGVNSIQGWTNTTAPAVRSTTGFDNFSADSGLTFGGDGVKGDGSLYLNATTAGSFLWTLDLTGTMDFGEAFLLSGSAFNANASQNSNYTISLFNVTDNVALVTSGDLGRTRIGAVNDNTNAFTDFSLLYTAKASDIGDVLQIRVNSTWNDPSRDAYFDYITLAAAVPEPGLGALILLGFSTLLFTRKRVK